MQNIKRKDKLTFSITFITVFFVSIIILTGFINYKRKLNIEYGSYLLNSEASSIQHAVDLRMLKLQTLEMVVVANENSVQRFDEIASELCIDDPSIQSLHLAPAGNIEYSYPENIDKSSLSDISQTIAGQTMKLPEHDQEKMTLSGPYELFQGQNNILIKCPISVQNDTYTKKDFWGYAVAVIDIDKLLDMLNISDLNNSNYYYSIWKKDFKTEQLEFIYGNSNSIPANSISYSLSLPESLWQLNINPVNGWITNSQFVLYIGITLLIDILFSSFCFYFIRSLKQKRELDILAYKDPLTGLYNTRYLNETLDRLQKENQPFLLFVLDMNKFKHVNDTYGHQSGDTLLTEAATRLRKCIRDNDYAFRIGGDEFLLIIVKDDTSPTGEELTQAIKSSIIQPININDITLNVHTSCGYALYPDENLDLKELFRIADKRMYDDKSEGR